MKKIIFIIPSLCGGGAERIVQLLLQHLGSHQVNLILVVFENKFEYEIPKNVQTICLYKKNRFDFLRIIKNLADIFREHNPHVIMSFLTTTNIVSVLAHKLAGGKSRLLLSEHNNIALCLKHGRMAKLKQWLIRYTYRLSDLIVCVSEGTGDHLREYFGIPQEMLKVIYNSVDIPRIRFLASSEEPDHPWLREKKVPVIVSMGRLHVQKAFVDLLHAVAMVRQVTPCRLIIAGQGEEYTSLMNLAQELNIAQDIDLIGFKKNPFTYVARSDVFVLPSHWEGFGNVLIEAMACGVPVISTDCPFGPAEIIQHERNGLLVPVGNVRAMAESILKVFSDSSLRRTLVQEGSTRAKFFSVNRMVEEYSQLFELQQDHTIG